MLSLLGHVVGSKSSLNHSFIEYLPSTYSVPGSVLEAHMGEIDTYTYTIQHEVYVHGLMLREEGYLTWP